MQTADYLGGSRPIQPHFAGEHFTDALDQQFRRRAFLDDSGSPEAHGLKHLIPFLRRSQEDDLGIGVCRPQALQCNQPVLSRHTEIQENDIGLVPSGHFQNFIAMAGFGDNVKIRDGGK